MQHIHEAIQQHKAQQVSKLGREIVEQRDRLPFRAFNLAVTASVARSST